MTKEKEKKIYHNLNLLALKIMKTLKICWVVYNMISVADWKLK